MSAFDGAYWEDRYAAGQPTSKAAVSPSLLVEAAGLAPGTALDAGCGHGADARWLADQGWSVTAVDVSATAVEAARATDDRVAWQTADLTTWDPGRQFDLVTCSYVHVPGPPRALSARLASWVAPGGTLLVVGHAPGGDHPHGAHGDAHRVTSVLDPAAWEVQAAEQRTHTVDRPGGAGPVTLHDVVVRARRRP